MNSLETAMQTFKGKIEETLDNRIVSYFSSLMCVFWILILTMSLGIFHSKRKSKRHYQFRQNVFTLNSTLFWGLLHFGLFISLYLTLKTMEKSHVLSFLRFLMAFSHIIKSIVTIFENQKNLPELFSDMKTNEQSSYFNFTNFSPRHQSLMPFIPFRQNAR